MTKKIQIQFLADKESILPLRSFPDMGSNILMIKASSLIHQDQKYIRSLFVTVPHQLCSLAKLRRETNALYNDMFDCISYTYCSKKGFYGGKLSPFYTFNLFMWRNYHREIMWVSKVPSPIEIKVSCFIWSIPRFKLQVSYGHTSPRSVS